MSDIIWINPIVRGSCTPGGGCGSACCKMKIYSDAVNYTEEWCKYYNQDPAVELKCMNYENRYDGCKRYPTEHVLMAHPTYPKCGYYIEESQSV